MVGLQGSRRYKPATSSLKRNYTAMTERTFSILKPDATERNLTGAINAVIEKAGLRIVAQKRIKMSRADAEQFYGVHKERPFFGELVETMTSAPVVVQVLEGEGAIARYREIMGATNPAQAAEGTIPQALRQVHRRELRAWLRRAGDRQGRDRPVLPRGRDRRLSRQPSFPKRGGRLRHRLHVSRRSERTSSDDSLRLPGTFRGWA